MRGGQDRTGGSRRAGSSDGEWHGVGRSARRGAGSTTGSRAKANGQWQQAKDAALREGARLGGQAEQAAEEARERLRVDARCQGLLDIPFTATGSPLACIRRQACTYRCQTHR